MGKEGCVMEAALTEAHKVAAKALGEIALALAARRGVTGTKLRDWARWLRLAADKIEEISNGKTN